MSGRRTAVLAAALLVLAVYFALFEGFSVTQPEPPWASGAKIVDCGAGAPTELALAVSRGAVSARREGEEWTTSAGGFAPGAFTDLAEALCRLPIIDRIGSATKLEDFGLDPALAEIRMVIGGRERRLRIGAPTPADNLMYVKFGDQTDVLKVGMELRASVDRISAFAGGSS
jgi:hypothetical protein